MNVTAKKPQSVTVAPPKTIPAVPKPRDLPAAISAICEDARIDSLRYVLRSNTGHDGE